MNHVNTKKNTSLIFKFLAAVEGQKKAESMGLDWMIYNDLTSNFFPKSLKLDNFKV
jgi:hypothetical protein